MDQHTVWATRSLKNFMDFIEGFHLRALIRKWRGMGRKIEIHALQINFWLLSSLFILRIILIETLLQKPIKLWKIIINLNISQIRHINSQIFHIKRHRIWTVYICWLRLLFLLKRIWNTIRDIHNVGYFQIRDCVLWSSMVCIAQEQLAADDFVGV